MSKTFQAFAIGGVGIGLVLAPAAHADTPKSPATPIIRTADRGHVMSGAGETRIADVGAVQGGGVSAGAVIPISDGNAATMPKITGGAAIICTTGQPVQHGVIQC